jgi:hypothetical protein
MSAPIEFSDTTRESFSDRSLRCLVGAEDPAGGPEAHEPLARGTGQEYRIVDEGLVFRHGLPAGHRSREPPTTRRRRAFDTPPRCRNAPVQALRGAEIPSHWSPPVQKYRFMAAHGGIYAAVFAPPERALPLDGASENRRNPARGLPLGPGASHRLSHAPSILGLKTAARMPLDCPQVPRSGRGLSSFGEETHVRIHRERP